ncbi:MAG: TetR/AcrR family transcriptional regulator [Proteobacteria bacterium]|nr:TetR/AcrR family transcriptional regulator [Pseudomonadota bacterium]
MDAREARSARRREQTRDEILNAARRVLDSHGLARLSLAAVARELQLTKAALYYYFPSKEALLFELLFGALTREVEALEEALNEGSTKGATALETMIRSLATHHAAHPLEVKLVYLHPQLATDAAPFDEAMLARLRPLNARIFGRMADLIDADREAERLPPGLPARRLAFLAHTAVVGLSTVQGLIRTADSAPLIHSDSGLVDGLVAQFCGAPPAD